MPGAAAGRLGDAGEDLQPCPELSRRERALARAVTANACPEPSRRDADDFAALDPSIALRTSLEGDVAEGPEVFRGLKIED
jgi:hypothetical protein